MSASVATVSTVQAAAIREAKPGRDLVAGTMRMREMGETYLPRHPAESRIAYASRLRRSFLYPAAGRAVSEMTGRVFRKPILLEKDVPTEINAFAENIDGAGRSLQEFSRAVFQDSLVPGIGFIYVDAPPAIVRGDGSPGTLADYKRANWRPYLTFIPMEAVLGWKTDTVNGAEKITQIRIHETVTVPNGDYTDVQIEQIRVVTVADTGCTWETFRQPTDAVGKQAGNYAAHENGTISLPEIPIAPVYLNRTGFMAGKPPLDPLFETNIAHFQSASDQRNLLHNARVPILLGTGFEATEQLEIGANTMILSTNPTATLKFVEHTGAAIGSGRDDLKDLEFQMQTLGLHLLIPQPGGQTATGEIRDDARENSALAAMARGLQDALEQAFGFMAKFLNVAVDGDKAGGSVVVNTDFGVISTGDIQYLTQAVIAGKLDNQTYLDELKRRGILSDSVIVDAVLDRIDYAPPELSGTDLLADDHSH